MDVIFKQQEHRLEVSFSSKDDLYQAHMPFIKPIGLFVPGSFLFKLGEKIDLSLKLLFVKKNICIPGKVVFLKGRSPDSSASENPGNS